MRKCEECNVAKCQDRRDSSRSSSECPGVNADLGAIDRLLGSSIVEVALEA